MRSNIAYAIRIIVLVNLRVRPSIQWTPRSASLEADQTARQRREWQNKTPRPSSVSARIPSSSPAECHR